jgi:hypothetical protein
LNPNVWIGPNVVITNAKYPRSPLVKENLKGALVRRGAKIGANATLLPGIEIGANALVGAGSTVTKDVPADAVVAGNPARIIKTMSELPYRLQSITWRRMNIPLVDLQTQYEAIRADIDAAIANVIRDTAFVGGKYVKSFEESFAEYCGTSYAVGGQQWYRRNQAGSARVWHWRRRRSHHGAEHFYRNL